MDCSDDLSGVWQMNDNDNDHVTQECVPPEDFSEHPKSINEIRSDRSTAAADWTPRDALIATLRRIDNGELVADALCIIYAQPKEPGREKAAAAVGYTLASEDMMITLGMIDVAKFMMIEAVVS